MDCLLPGQIRRLGSMTYTSARKAIKVNAAECERSGGEYVAFDRANFATTLRVWLPLANEGNIEAQTYVGEAYEKRQALRQHDSDAVHGYSAAAHWYLKAAEQGHSRAAINLGNLFEQGHGVDRDEVMADYWYQQAYAPDLTATSNSEKSLVKRAEQKNAPRPKRTGSGYQALIIGNNHYQSLPALDTAVSDARAIATLLQQRYGFGVELLIDASRYDVLSTLNQYKRDFGPDTRLLVYYAGHGDLDRVNKRGHWLPVDAQADNTANWISNIAVTDLLNIFPARQLMVIADSCYSGMMSRSALGVLERSMSNIERAELLHSLSSAKTRTVFTSGGVAPVIDGLGGGHSVFATELINALKENTNVLSGFELFNQVAPKVTAAAARVGFVQVPEYAPLKFSGHEGGDFIFRPVDS